MSSDNSNLFWQGKAELHAGHAQRKVKLDGKRSVALKLLPLTAPLFDTYKTTLYEAGRHDLPRRLTTLTITPPLPSRRTPQEPACSSTA